MSQPAPTLVGVTYTSPLARSVCGGVMGPYENGADSWIIATNRVGLFSTDANWAAYKKTGAGASYNLVASGPLCSDVVLTGPGALQSRGYVYYRGTGVIIDIASQLPTGELYSIEFNMTSGAFQNQSMLGVTITPYYQLGQLTMTVNGAGKQIVAWFQQTLHILASCKTAGVWSTPVEVDDGSAINFSLDQAVINSGGNVVFLFYQGSMGFRLGFKLWAIYNGSTITSRGTTAISASVNNEPFSMPMYDSASNSIVFPMFKTTKVGINNLADVSLLIGNPSTNPTFTIQSVKVFGLFETSRLQYICITRNTAGDNFTIFWQRRVMFTNEDIIERTSNATLTGTWPLQQLYYNENLAPPLPLPVFQGMGPTSCITTASGLVAVIAGLIVQTPFFQAAVPFTWAPEAPPDPPPPDPPTATCPASNFIAVGTPYSQTIVISGGTPTYSLELVAGVMPPGLSLNLTTGLISGTPTDVGAYPFTVRITDSASPTPSIIQLSCSFRFAGSGGGTITAICQINNSIAINVAIGEYYFYTLTASGGSPPYTFQITGGGLPPGLVLDPDTGIISGTATASGTYTYVVSVTDANGDATTVSCSLAVSDCADVL